MTLTKDEREAAIEAAGLAKAHAHYAYRFGKSVDDPHVVMNAKANWRALWKDEDEAALDAVLPLIERAVRRSALEEAAEVANDPDAIEFARDMGGPLALIEISTRREIAEAIRALADEVRG